MKYEISVMCGSNLVNTMHVDSEMVNAAYLSGITLRVTPEGVFTFDGLVKLSGRKRLSVKATKVRATRQAVQKVVNS